MIKLLATPIIFRGDHIVNVKYVQTYPCPEKLPDTAILGAKLVD
jgi:hypothetical protein